MKSREEQDGPVTPFERNFYILILTIFLGLLAAEVIHDFKPVKLAVLFFILFWPPLMVLHEVGHALMADLLGWEIRRIVLGFNRDVWRFRVRGIPVVVKLLPLGGYVSPAPRNLSWPRLKFALIYLAGPGIELLLLAGLVGWFGLSTFRSPSDSHAR